MKKLKVATDCSGIGSVEQALKELNVKHEIVFACDVDKYARKTYLANFKPKFMFEDMTIRDNVQKQLYSDLYVAGIPCQSFSLAGKRLGEADPRGLLFYNFYDYVKKQQPKYFIIENVKGLLSDNGGATFQTWLDLLSNSVNTLYNMFNHEDSLEYNVHWTVLNSKDFGVPQNRERVFIVGIRKDLPNTFRFPVGRNQFSKLKDILEIGVDEKYFLSEKKIEWIRKHREKRDSQNKFPFTENDICSCLNARYAKYGAEDIYILQDNKIRRLTPLESFRLQAFPDDFNKPVPETIQYKQAGNTITTKVIKGICKNLINAD